MKVKQIGRETLAYANSGRLDIEVLETEDGRRFYLDRWNSEMWGECWEVLPDKTFGPSFEARPVYRFELEGIDLSTIEENSKEWDHAVEIIEIEIIPTTKTS